MKQSRRILHIESPIAICGGCGFASTLYGNFSVEDGRLVWRAAADPLPSRGPDLESCCESSPVVTFETIEVENGDDIVNLSYDDAAALRRTASEARGAHLRQLEER